MEQRRVTLASGIALDVADTGPRDAPPLIFLHGFPESHRTWRHQIAHLSDRYRCIAPDQRGYRGSSKPREVAAYTPDKLIADIFQLAEALETGPFTVVGHDWGGAIAWGVALAGQFARDGASSRVTRAIVANAPHPAVFQRLLYTDRVQRAASQYVRGFRDPANDALVRAHGLAAIIMKEVDRDRPAPMEDAERDRLLAEWQDRDAAFAMLNWYRASPVDVPPMDAPFAPPQDWQAPALPRLSIPTLVIWGMRDHALPPENLAGIRDEVDRLTLIEVPESGHFVPWEAPEAVNAALAAFLDQTEPATGA